MKYKNYMILRFFIIHFFTVLYFLSQCTLKTKKIESLRSPFDTNHTRNLSEQDEDFLEKLKTSHVSTKLNPEECNNMQAKLEDSKEQVSEKCNYEEASSHDSEQKMELSEMQKMWKDMINEQLSKNDMINATIQNWDNVCLVHGTGKFLTGEVCKQTRLGCWDQRKKINMLVKNVQYFNEFKCLEEQGCTKESFLTFLHKAEKEMEDTRNKQLIMWKEYLNELVTSIDQYISKCNVSTATQESEEEIKKDDK
ncbi:Plasmodium exported protein, unknown function [Plasmodium relictum]|uniref:Plasmodium RESA N-terminal domain-containing protein n=1 Tax=Plasmodium relictum TaxID=85471 RepID=A0A1J1GKP4_PLARL|nr:Plasmodium exported protein, unknown function [Plasmodium relictum]CRG85713.1 Plasmodium exported protein, unknown function [Plasmodium relictum]